MTVAVKTRTKDLNLLLSVRIVWNPCKRFRILGKRYAQFFMDP
jgi:hypothetical protein